MHLPTLVSLVQRWPLLLTLRLLAVAGAAVLAAPVLPGPAQADVNVRAQRLSNGTLRIIRQSQNSTFARNTRYCSSNRKACLVFQSDGNLVVYDERNRARWDTRTNGRRGTSALFQADGNLVVYSFRTPLWASGTNRPTVRYLDVQSDGNVVIQSAFNPGGTLCCVPIWSTRTNH